MVNKIALISKLSLVVVLTILAVACSTKDISWRDSQLKSHHELVDEYQKYPNQSPEGLVELNKQFWTLDDPVGVWKTYIMLAEYYRAKEPEKAQDYNRQAEVVATNLSQSHLLYETYMQRYLILGQSEWLSRARDFATSTFERNEVNWHSGNQGNLVAPSETEPANEQAWSWYWLAYSNNDQAMLNKAIALFRDNSITPGLADSYALMARLNREQCQWHTLKAKQLYTSLAMTEQMNALLSWAEANGCLPN